MSPAEEQPNPQSTQVEEPGPGDSKAMKALKIGVPLLLLIVGAMWFYYRDRVSTDDAQVDGHLVPVASRVYGSVEQVLVQDNQAVKEGDLLVRIDPKDTEVKVAQARAGLAQAQAQVQGAVADLQRSKVSFDQAQGSDVDNAAANLDAKKASLDKAAADLARMRPLAERQEISALMFDGFKAQADVAEGEWRAAQKRLASLHQEAGVRKVSVGSQEARLTAAQAQVEQAKANLEALELQLGYTRILASVDGVVTRKLVETGQIIQPGQGLMTLVPLHQVWVTANFKETQLRKVRPGQEAEVKVDMNGAVLKAKVDSIAGSTGSRMSLLPPENAVGNFVKVVQRIPVKLRIDDQEAGKVQLRPGMNVEATIIVK
jgi:membrane fusion protein (multidrug efflux system)